MTLEQTKAAQEISFKEQKEIALTILKSIIDVEKNQIFVTQAHPLGWDAIIRTDKLDLVLTYYNKDSWKIETFPVYAASGGTKRATLVDRC